MRRENVLLDDGTYKGLTDFPLLELLHRCGAKRNALLRDFFEDETSFPERVLKFLSEREELFQKSSR
jgi:hypothetical protein